MSSSSQRSQPAVSQPEPPFAFILALISQYMVEIDVKALGRFAFTYRSAKRHSFFPRSSTRVHIRDLVRAGRHKIHSLISQNVIFECGHSFEYIFKHQDLLVDFFASFRRPVNITINANKLNSAHPTLKNCGLFHQTDFIESLSIQDSPKSLGLRFFAPLCSCVTRLGYVANLTYPDELFKSIYAVQPYLKSVGCLDLALWPPIDSERLHSALAAFGFAMTGKCIVVDSIIQQMLIDEILAWRDLRPHDIPPLLHLSQSICLEADSYLRRLPYLFALCGSVAAFQCLLDSDIEIDFTLQSHSADVAQGIVDSFVVDKNQIVALLNVLVPAGLDLEIGTTAGLLGRAILLKYGSMQLLQCMVEHFDSVERVSSWFAPQTLLECLLRTGANLAAANEFAVQIMDNASTWNVSGGSNSANSAGENILHYAIENPAMAYRIALKNPELSLTPRADGLAPVHMCHPNVLKLLLSINSVRDGVRGTYLQLLHYFSRQRHYACVNVLLDVFAEMDGSSARLILQDAFQIARSEAPDPTKPAVDRALAFKFPSSHALCKRVLTFVSDADLRHLIHQSLFSQDRSPTPLLKLCWSSAWHTLPYLENAEFQQGGKGIIFDVLFSNSAAIVLSLLAENATSSQLTSVWAVWAFDPVRAYLEARQCQPTQFDRAVVHAFRSLGYGLASSHSGALTSTAIADEWDQEWRELFDEEISSGLTNLTNSVFQSGQSLTHARFDFSNAGLNRLIDVSVRQLNRNAFS